MTCKEFEEALDFLAGDDLPESDARRLRAHTDDCPSCGGLLMKTEMLQTATRGLATSVQPERDLWPEIALRLQQPKTSSWKVLATGRGRLPRAVFLWPGLAACVLFCAGLGWGYLHHEQGRSLPAPVAESQYEQARRELRALLEAREDALSPEVRIVVEQNLEVIDNAVADIKVALRERPENAELLELLASAQRKELQLLTALVQQGDDS